MDKMAASDNYDSLLLSPRQQILSTVGTVFDVKGCRTSMGMINCLHIAN